MVREHKVCADGNDQHPVVGLDDEDLGHEAVEGAELSLLGRPDPPPTDVQGGRQEEVESHDAVADRQAEDEVMAESAEGREHLGYGAVSKVDLTASRPVPSR